MATLKEILAKQREMKQNAVNATQSTQAPQREVQRVEGPKNIPTSAVNSGSASPSTAGTAPTGSGSGEKTSVVVKGLSAFERLKARKQNDAQVKPIVEKIPEKSTSNPTPATQPNVEAPREKFVGTGEASKNPGVSDGAIDTTQLRRNLEYLANNIEQKELVGQIVRTIAIQLKQNPELTSYMKDADVDLVVRGLRRAYNIAARKKTEARETKSKKTAMDDELTSAFKAAGLNFS